MKFSIIIPTYNYGKYLPRAIDSVLTQGHRDYEIIIVDDGSTDDTAEIARTYQDKSTRNIDYVFQDNQGLSSARNHGVRRSSGEYLLFLDADDELLPDALSLFVIALQQTANIDFVVGGRQWIGTDGKVRHRPAKRLSSSRMENFRRLVRGRLGKISVGCFVVHRRVFHHIRFPEDKIRQPIIYQIGREYNVVTDVRRADVRETTGWADVELSGETAEIERAIEGLRKKGCVVDPIELNVVE